MNGKAIQNREGFVEIQKGYHDSLVLVGLNIPGRVINGIQTNRTVLISREAPAWFQVLCWRWNGTKMKLRVRVVALYKDSVAYAVPVAQTEEEALREWKTYSNTHPEECGEISETTPEEVIEYATRAHEQYALENNLTVLEHTLRGNSIVITIAQNSQGGKFAIKGGFIVGKLKKHIGTGAVTFEDQIKRFVQATPFAG